MTIQKSPQTPQKANWYQLPVSEVISTLAADKTGLTSSEANLRLKNGSFSSSTVP